MRRFIYILIIFLISGICLSSCRSIKYVPLETIRTEYKTRDSIRFDSIYQRDSIYILIKGDTILQYKYKSQYHYLIINKVDTVIKTDSVHIPYPVEKRLTWWQQVKIELGGWAFGVIISIILFVVYWLVHRMQKK